MWVAAISQRKYMNSIPSKTSLQTLLDPKVLKPLLLISVHANGGDILARPWQLSGARMKPEHRTPSINQARVPVTTAPHGTKAQVLQTSKQEGNSAALGTSKSHTRQQQRGPDLGSPSWLTPSGGNMENKDHCFQTQLLYFPSKWWHLMGTRDCIHSIPLGMDISYRSLFHVIWGLLLHP